MRDIKFRAWWRDTGKFVPNFMEEYVVNDCNDKEYLIVEQYTGLKDKNSVEIYEGDFLHIDNSRICARDVKGKVVFEYGCFNVVDDKNIYYTFCEMGESIISVIGNIHENPELIEEN